ncbi:pentatricopeptide repeat-containing protein [Tanacetum coccineum]
MYMSDDSESGESLKSFDYLSEGEAEVIELRKRMTQFRSGDAEGEEEVEGNDNDQNDSFDDEGFVTPKRMFDMGISDTVKEHEQDMNALMRRIKGKGCELKDPFTMVDKNEKYPIYDEATHWKLKKPKLGEKFVNVDQFKECLTYYALANGFSLWYATSSTDRVIAKCGHRKEVIKDPSANCEAVENGFSECFDAVLVSVRHKPIITILESMRVLLMYRMHTMRLIMEKWTSEVCPKIQSILEHTKDQQSKFEVRKGYDAFTVDEVANTCSCRMWQISGLPCVHDVACIFKLNKMVEPYVPECFKLEMFKQAYTQFMKPVEGITFWPYCSRLSRILGPLPKRRSGRPKKKRIRASHESQSTTKISRSGLEMTCHNCWQKGHNKKGCKNDPIPKTPKVKGKMKGGKSSRGGLVPTERLGRIGGWLGLDANKNKRGGKLGGTCFVKMRGGKSSRGRLVPTERLGRIERWLGEDAATSDPIDPRENTLGVKLTRGKHSRSAFIGSTSSSPRVTRQTMNEPPPPQPQVRRRQQAHMPPREKSQRILLRKVSQKITGRGSSIDNEIVIE